MSLNYTFIPDYVVDRSFRLISILFCFHDGVCDQKLPQINVKNIKDVGKKNKHTEYSANRTHAISFLRHAKYIFTNLFHAFQNRKFF